MTVSCSLCVVGIGLGPNFSTCIGSGWVSHLMGWVGLGHTKWTLGQLCGGFLCSPVILVRVNVVEMFNCIV